MHTLIIASEVLRRHLVEERIEGDYIEEIEGREVAEVEEILEAITR